MFKNHLLTAIRHIKGDKGYSLINIAGLSIGLACFILFFFSWKYENSFDKFHTNACNIYKMTGMIKYAGREREWEKFDSRLPASLKENLPEVQAATALGIESECVVLIGNNFFKEEVSYASESVFSVFTIPVVKVLKEKCLDNPQAVMLSESKAKKYFGSEYPLGKTIKIKSVLRDEVKEFVVMGITGDLPSASTIKMDIICSMACRKNSSAPTYVVLNRKESLLKAETGIAALIKSKFLNEDNANITPTSITLKSFTALHLADERITKYLSVFGWVSLVILLLSCVNYINLSIGLSIKRIREIGIRKTLGSSRAELVIQHLIKSALTNSIALLAALMFVYLLIKDLPYSDLLREINLKDIADLRLIAGIAVIFAVVTLLSGVYPAFYISRLNPAALFSKSGTGLQKGGMLKNGIIFIQFAALTVFIIISFGISNQLSYLENADYGFRHNNLLVMDVVDMTVKPDVFRNEMLKNNHVKNVSFHIGGPLSFGVTEDARIEGRDELISFKEISASADFLNTMSISLADGRNLSEADTMQNGGQNALINETAAKMFRTGSAVGQTLTLQVLKGKIKVPCRVVGVLKDFHLSNMHTGISPAIIRLASPRFVTSIAVKTDGTDDLSTLSYIKATFNSLFPNVIVKYSFADEILHKSYEPEYQLGLLSKIFTALSVIISVMGLFGLTALSTERRKKEIGIRRVLGATIKELAFTFIKDIRVPAIAANIAALPVGIFLISKWFESFVYKTSIPVGFYILIIGISFTIAVVTIGAQVYRAARANPVDSLRNE